MAFLDSLFSLQGRVALVTGGNGGIGRALALGMQKAGAAVAVTGRNPQKNAAIAEELGAANGQAGAVFSLDVRDPDSVQETVAQVVEQFGRLDILVNNAGTITRTSLLAMTHEEWQRVLQTHLDGAFLCAQAAARHMVSAGTGGKIINIGSMYSIFGPPINPHYATAKTGMVGLTRALAVELAQHNIQVNAILPGWYETDLNRTLLQSPVGEQIRHKTPACRLGDLDDLVGAAIFLASPASDFVTGVSMPVDGGYSVSDRPWTE